MGCSADDELAAEVSAPLDAEAIDRARKALARIVSSSPPPKLHPNALSLAVGFLDPRVGIAMVRQALGLLAES